MSDGIKAAAEDAEEDRRQERLLKLRQMDPDLLLDHLDAIRDYFRQLNLPSLPLPLSTHNTAGFIVERLRKLP